MKAFLMLLSIAGMALAAGCSRDYYHQGAPADSDRVAADTAASGSVFSDLPRPVAETMRLRAPRGHVVAVLRHKPNGKDTVYEIHFSDAERYPAMRIAEDGTFLSYKE
jgi:hypothetical protein